MTASGGGPDVLALIQEIHASLDQDDYPLSRVLPKVIRVATLLGNYPVAVRYRLESVETSNKGGVKALLDSLDGRVAPDQARLLKAAIIDDWLKEREATMANAASRAVGEDRRAVGQTIADLEVAARELKKAYDQTFITEQGYWFRVLAKPWQQQEVYNERNSHFITLKDIESVTARLRTNITNYLAGAEASVVAARNAAQQAREAQTVTAAPTVDKRKVFVVYGQDEIARSSLFSFLRAAGLDPMEWNELVQITAKVTGDASPYVGDIIDVGMSQAQAVVVLFTGDEEAILRDYLT